MVNILRRMGIRFRLSKISSGFYMTVKLSKKEFDSINEPIHFARGLPSACYTTKEWEEIDRETSLATSWSCLGYCYDLSPGGYKTIEFLGIPLIIICDETGLHRVFHNVCRHRGHRLLDSTGLLNGAIQCPYHGWTYRLDGMLKAAPHIGGFGTHELEDEYKSQHGLLEVRSTTWLGLIFVNMSGDAVEFLDYIAPLRSRWASFLGTEGFDQFLFPETNDLINLRVNANWKLVVDNYCESYHLPWVHPNLNSYSQTKDHYNIVINELGSGQGTKKFSFVEEQAIKLPKFSGWPKKDIDLAEYIALYPNLLLGLHSDHFFVIVVHPIANDETLENILIYYPSKEVGSSEYEAARRQVLAGWLAVFQEDVKPLEGMQKGRESKAFDGGIFSPILEIPTHAFHCWVAQKYPKED